MAHGSWSRPGAWVSCCSQADAAATASGRRSGNCLLDLRHPWPLARRNDSNCGSAASRSELRHRRPWLRIDQVTPGINQRWQERGSWLARVVIDCKQVLSLASWNTSAWQRQQAPSAVLSLARESPRTRTTRRQTIFKKQTQTWAEPQPGYKKRSRKSQRSLTRQEHRTHHETVRRSSQSGPRYRLRNRLCTSMQGVRCQQSARLAAPAWRWEARRPRVSASSRPASALRGRGLQQERAVVVSNLGSAWKWKDVEKKMTSLK